MNAAPISFAHDFDRDIVTVEGIRYSGIFFRELSIAPIGSLLEIHGRDDGVLTITNWPELFEIADSCCRSDIEGNCVRDDAGWYDATVDADNKHWLPQCLRHLEARKMIEHDPLAHQLVRFVKVPA